MGKRVFCLLSAALTFPLAAQTDLAQSQKALDLILKFSTDMCANPSLRGSSNSSEVRGVAKAEVSKLTRQIADLRLEGNAKIQSDEYQGLLQKDLLEATKNATTCRQNIYNDLIGRLLPRGEIGPKRPSDSSDGTAKPKLPFAANLWLGMSKSDIVAALGGSVDWKMSGDNPPLEYFVLPANYAGFPTTAKIFLRNGKLSNARIEFQSEAGIFKYEKRWPKPGEEPDVRRFGISEDAHATQCQQYYDKVLSTLLNAYSLPSGGLPEVQSSTNGEIEADNSGDKIQITRAVRKTRQGTFLPIAGWAPVQFNWTDSGQVYTADRPQPGGVIIGTKTRRQFTCSLQLRVASTGT